MTTTPWLTLIGLGEEGYEALPPRARAALATATTVLGGQRHLDHVAAYLDAKAERLTWPRPLADILPVLCQRRGKAVSVLASGDPMWYGIGTYLLKAFDKADITILPAPSAFSLAAARLGWPLNAIQTLTLHGRPIDKLAAYIRPGARLLILAHDRHSPAAIAAKLCRDGYHNATITVLEHMGGRDETIHHARAEDWQQRSAQRDLITLAVDLRAITPPQSAGLIVGLDDTAFHHDGTATKHDIRILTLSHLAPMPGAHLWDIGAGSGAIAIEWLRTAPDMLKATAFESIPSRIEAIRANALRLGAPELRIIAGTAPDSFAGIEPPDAVFIGGGLLCDGMFEQAWGALRPGGRIVVNVVTAAAEAYLVGLAQRYGGTLARIAITRCHPDTRPDLWRPLTPVTQWRCVKAAADEEPPCA